MKVIISITGFISMMFLLFFPRMLLGQGGLPERAFNIEEGSIGIQAGVMRGSHQSLPFMGKPTVYFIILRNETESSIWTEVKLYLKKSPLKMKGNTEAGKSTFITWESWGVKKDKEIPLEIFIYSDKKRKELIGSEKTYLYFDSGSVDHFFKAAFDRKKGIVPAISGWPEMKIPELVSGSLADSSLQRDIAWRLFKEESKSHRDCEHSITKAEPYGSEESLIAEKIGGDAPELGDNLRSKGEMVLEKWHVKSCDFVTTYEVLLLRSPEGGTDIMIERIGEQNLEK